MTPFDASGRFRDEGESGLRRTAIRGAAATLLSSGWGIAIQMIATVVLARLLKASDFGLVAMVTTFSIVFMNFGLNGITEAIVQRPALDRALAGNLFWISVGGGSILTAAFAAFGPLLARFFGDGRVRYAAAGVSLTILATSFSVVHLALLKRGMQFSAVSVNEAVARVLSVTASIALGVAGLGYWALVGGAVVLQLSISVGAWCLCRWVPGMPRGKAGTRAAVSFACSVYGRYGLEYVSRNVDNVLVGWRFNAEALGFYKRAFDLFALSAFTVVSRLTVLGVTALSRCRRDTVQYERQLLGALSVLALIGAGTSAALTLTGRDLIRLLLGPGWEESGRIFCVFGAGIGAAMIYGAHSWIHLSLGRADRCLRWGVVEFLVTGASFLAALRWGPIGLAGAWTASYWILIVPAFWYAGRPIGLGAGPVIAVVWKFAAAAVLAGLVCSAALEAAAPFAGLGDSAGAALVRVSVTSSLFLALYLAAVGIIHGGLGPLRRLVSILRDLVPPQWFRKVRYEQ